MLQEAKDFVLQRRGYVVGVALGLAGGLAKTQIAEARGVHSPNHLDINSVGVAALAAVYMLPGIAGGIANSYAANSAHHRAVKHTIAEIGKIENALGNSPGVRLINEWAARLEAAQVQATPEELIPRIKDTLIKTQKKPKDVQQSADEFFGDMAQQIVQDYQDALKRHKTLGGNAKQYAGARRGEVVKNAVSGFVAAEGLTTLAVVNWAISTYANGLDLGSKIGVYTALASLDLMCIRGVSWALQTHLTDKDPRKKK